MKSTFLKFCEEKYYFKISFWFWHVLAGLAGLAIIGGMLIFLWGILPSFKPGVSKPRYPKPIKVSAVDINQIMAPDKAAGKQGTQTAATANTKEAKRRDPKQEVYRKSIDNMKTLLPPGRYTWKSRGHWERGYYKNKWVVDQLGIDDRLKAVYRKINITDFKAKKKLVDTYATLLVKFTEKQRLQVLKSAIEYSKESLTVTLVNIGLLQASVPNFPDGNADFIKTLARFGKKNPRDGRIFIRYVNKIIPKFTIEIRRSVLDVLVKYYYGHFKVFDKQKEATDLFLDLLPGLQSADQVKGLEGYYKLFLAKNKDRERRIVVIEQQYKNNLINAENTYSARRSYKAGQRALAWKLIGGGLVFIAVLAMFLVLLSIQRELKLLRERAEG